MGKIRLGMIGGGIGAFIGDAHRRAARICNDFELIGGIFDADQEKNRQFAIQEGLDLKRCYAAVDDLVRCESALPENERIQAISIVTPNWLHYPFAKILVGAGFHVICEKPMTMNAEEAVDLERMVESSKVTFVLTHTYTGYPMVRQMKDLISQGVLGNIQRVDAQYYQGWINSIIHGGNSRIKGIWRLNPRQAGISSCIADIGVHAFNLIEYTTGLKVKEVLSDLNTVKEEVALDLDATVLLRFNDTLKGVIRASQVCSGVDNDIVISVYGSRGSLVWAHTNPDSLTLLTENEPVRTYRSGHTYNGHLSNISHTLPPGHPEGMYEAFANIYKGAARSIRGEHFENGEFPTVRDGVRGMHFIHSVVDSNKKGNIWVKIPD